MQGSIIQTPYVSSIQQAGDEILLLKLLGVMIMALSRSRVSCLVRMSSRISQRFPNGLVHLLWFPLAIVVHILVDTNQRMQ